MAGALRKTMLYLGLAAEDPRDTEEWTEDETPEAEVPEQFEAQVTPLRRVERSVPRQPAQRDLRRITTIHPRSYNDAATIGQAFRDGSPVIVNLTDMDNADAKRLVDFSAGLVFGLHGAIERVTGKVFLLSPATVEVTDASAVPEAPGRPGVYNQS
jgi:cell division inhibitor SepF